MSSALNGSWILEKSENFDEVMKELGKFTFAKNSPYFHNYISLTQKKQVLALSYVKLATQSRLHLFLVTMEATNGPLK